MMSTCFHSRSNWVATSIEAVADACCQSRFSTGATAHDDGTSRIVNLDS
jgi:hypothetical protein